MSAEMQLHLADSLQISDEDLISKTTDTENNFIERKTTSDTDGWLKTAVAFANSCPAGFPGVLYIGVAKDGTIQRHKEAPNFEKLQKTISNVIDAAWPPIYFFSKTLKKSGAEFVAVVIPGSALRPHFSGSSYVRVGPETRKASEAQFDELIAQRSSKVRELQKLVGKIVYWHSLKAFPGNDNGKLVGCNQFFATIAAGQYKRCFPIDWITISFDPASERYQLIIQSES